MTTDKYYPCLSQSSVECLSHADPIDPYRWISQKPKAVNGGITNCNMCAGLELSLMSNGTPFVFIHPSDPNRYRQAVFVKTCAPEDRWNMRKGVAVPPKNLKQKDEDLLNNHRRMLQQQKQPEVKLVTNARGRARYTDLRAQGVTPREIRGEQPLELDDGKLQIDLVCFCIIVSCILIQVVLRFFNITQEITLRRSNSQINTQVN